MFTFLNNRWIDLRYFEGFIRNKKKPPRRTALFCRGTRIRTLDPPDLNRDALPDCATHRIHLWFKHENLSCWIILLLNPNQKVLSVFERFKFGF